jgi:hypothetical protein
LVLAAGGRPRPRRFRAPTPEESNLQIDVANLLRAHCLPDWRFTHIPSGGLRDIVTASHMKAFGLQRGWPDILLISPYGSARFLELKRRGEDLSFDQAELRAWCGQHGVPYVIARTLDEALQACESWGCLRIRISSRGGSSL